MYSDYDFNPDFTEKTFTNEVLSFEKDATKKDTAFWNTLRPVPLTKEETQDYSLKDSIKTIRKSKKYLDSLDLKGNKFGLFDPLSGYSFRNSYENWSFSYNGPLLRTGFNTVQGFNASAGFSYFKTLNEEGKWWNAGLNFNYGFSDKRLRPTFYFSKKWDNFSKPRLSISGEIKNGIYFFGSLEYAKRTPLFNTTDYSFAKQDTNGYTSNNPLNPTDFNNGAFVEHNIATLNIGTTFVFGQKYLSYPDMKVNQGNDKYPTISVNYIKRFGASNTELNSDLFLANIRQNITAGNFGDFAYHIRGGAFLKQKNIAFMDKLQANGNQLLFPIDRELNSFNLLDYYRYYTNDKYAEMHMEHDFKGSILGKIPLVNKLNFHLILGGKVLFMADKNPYSEYSVGLANLGFGKYRFLRLEYVNANYGNINESGLVFRASLF